MTSRAGPRRKASTWVSCPGRSSSCSGITRRPCLRWCPALQSPAPEQARQPVVLYAVAGDPDPGDTPADDLTLAVHPEGASRPVKVAVRGTMSVRCPGRPGRVRAQPEPGDRRAVLPRLKRRPHAEVPGIDFRRRRSAGRLPHEKAWRESLRELMSPIGATSATVRHGRRTRSPPTSTSSTYPASRA